MGLGFTMGLTIIGLIRETVSYTHLIATKHGCSNYDEYIRVLKTDKDKCLKFVLVCLQHTDIPVSYTHLSKIDSIGPFLDA